MRRRLVRQISLEDHCVYLYASLLGCDATRLIFDGSLFIAVNGRVEAEGRRFVFDREWELVHRVVDLGEIRHARMEEGSWRGQLARQLRRRVRQGPARPSVVPGRLRRPTASPRPRRPTTLPPEPDHPDPSLRYLEAVRLRRPADRRARPEPPGAGTRPEPGAARLRRQDRRPVDLPGPLRGPRQRDGRPARPSDVPLRPPRPVGRRGPPPGRRAVPLRLPRDRELRREDPGRRPGRGRGGRRHLLRGRHPGGARRLPGDRRPPDRRAALAGRTRGTT